MGVYELGDPTAKSLEEVWGGQGSGKGSSEGHWSWSRSHWVCHGVVDAVGIEAGGIWSHHSGGSHRSSQGSCEGRSKWSSQWSRSMERKETSLSRGHAEGNEL